MAVILYLNDDEEEALNSVLTALEDEMADIGLAAQPRADDVRLVRDRFDAAITDREHTKEGG